MNFGGFVGFFIRLECAAENLKLIAKRSVSVMMRRIVVDVMKNEA